MPDVPSAAAAALDRRRFLGGAWRAGPAEPPPFCPTEHSPARVLVQAAPARLDAVAATVAAIDGVRLVDVRPLGRLTVAIAPDTVAAAMAALAAVPGVLTVSVVAAEPEVHP
ncbi:chaperone NapD [Rhodoplanes azumiensis]|uniref:Chaperone NapD n=1 Tax=Rhodoplanes azumiensis TaxID=1897628 RepID=A0ABW5AIN3_9BRAD